VLKREKPDGIVISMGGQTALNCAVALYKAGTFEKYSESCIRLRCLYWLDHLLIGSMLSKRLSNVCKSPKNIRDREAW
jgi:hypothetical protein